MSPFTSFLQLLLLFLSILPPSTLANPHTTSPPPTEFDYKAVLKYSQAALGKTLGHYTLIDSATGKPISFAQFRGKPLVISLIYTSCAYTCPMTTKQLAKVVKIAQDALGNDSFAIATIGFDVPQDTPPAMRHFATLQGVQDDHWYFLSTDANTMKALTQNLGFTYYPSPRGYDHLVQATVVDAQGKIYQQVYGEVFSTPLLVEPLKQLILGESKPEQPFLEDLINKVRFFCTTYDPSRDAYLFDYSLFIGILVGLSIILSVLIFLAREFRRTRHDSANRNH